MLKSAPFKSNNNNNNNKFRSRGGRHALPADDYFVQVGQKSYSEILAERRARNCKNCNCATSVLAILIAIGAIIVAIVALSQSSYAGNYELYVTDRELTTRPYNHILAGSAAPLTLTLPNDLTPYIGRQYTVYSSTAQPHVIQITAGTLATTWDGVNTVATLGGGIGDGFVFMAVAKDRITIVGTPTNVAFS